MIHRDSEKVKQGDYCSGCLDFENIPSFLSWGAHFNIPAAPKFIPTFKSKVAIQKKILEIDARGTLDIFPADEACIRVRYTLVTIMEVTTW